MPIGRASSAFPVTPLLAVLLLAACTFDPLANWQAPRGGSFTVGDAIVVGDADVGSYDLLPAPFRVTGIDPERGDPAGDEAVVITGVGFVSGMEVTFNDVPAQYVQAQDGERLYLRTPAGAPGPADVRVIHPDGREELMKQAFLYGVPVEVASVEPDHGPAAGGTPVTVRGTGFLDGTTVVLGGRLLINLEQLDDTTVIGITAGGAPGPVDVIATNAVGAAQSADLFRYEAPVALYAIAPAFGASAGGDSVVLAGSGLSHDAEVQFLPADGEARVAEITGWNESGSRLQLRSPAGPVGAADVVVSVPGQGSVRLAGAWSWRSEAPEQAPLALVGVHPNTGAAAGGESVLLVTTGLPADAAPAVHFGEATAAVLGVDTETGLVAVQSPAGGPGRVDVSLTVDGERVAADDGFLYRASVALASVTPSAGTAEGGTEVVLRGVGFGPSAFVRFGALAAAAVEVVDEETIVCRTPPGSPGWVDVVVSFDDEALDAPAGSTYRLADAFEYEFGGTALFAVSPTRGSVAGGTYVELYGAEFPTRPLVRFGSWQAEDVTRVSPSKIVAYTPMVREAGALDVGVSGPEGAGVLLWGYAFFDPMGDGVGTWGPTVDGAINVTVLDAETDEPLPGAFAMLGTAAETPYQGWTDVNGQTTLSGPALRGPQLVSAAAPEYSAASYVEVDAENVVIELQPDNPQGSSGGGAGTTLPLGSLAGVIDNPDKYVPVPVASCDDVPTDSDPLCRPCESDEDCADPDSALAELACSDLGEDGGRCTSICGEGCPSGFSCTPLGGEARCVPSLGVRGVRCEITRRSPFWYAETESADVDMFTGAYLLESRLGDVAIVCLGGYEEWETGRFVGTRMGGPPPRLLRERHAHARAGRRARHPAGAHGPVPPRPGPPRPGRTGLPRLPGQPRLRLRWGLRARRTARGRRGGPHQAGARAHELRGRPLRRGADDLGGALHPRRARLHALRRALSGGSRGRGSRPATGSRRAGRRRLGLRGAGVRRAAPGRLAGRHDRRPRSRRRGRPAPVVQRRRRLGARALDRQPNAARARRPRPLEPRGRRRRGSGPALRRRILDRSGTAAQRRSVRRLGRRPGSLHRRGRLPHRRVLRGHLDDPQDHLRPAGRARPTLGRRRRRRP